MRLVSVVMGSTSIKAREDASAALLNYGYTFYETAKVKSAGEVLLKPRVYKSDGGYVTLAVPRDIVLTVGRGQIASLKSSAHLLKEPLIAPLAANQPIGELTISDLAGEVVSRVPLVPGKAVPEAGLWTRATDSVRLWFN
jgi:D-alanyl-D-alanine carboxypeptidase (penicillin-binding protein 5/6)